MVRRTTAREKQKHDVMDFVEIPRRRARLPWLVGAGRKKRCRHVGLPDGIAIAAWAYKGSGKRGFN
jgi:hypothetical protein